MSAHGKRYTEARATIDREKLYSPAEAVRLLKELPDAKFDETVEVHFRLGLNVRHADQQLRGTLMLPHGTGTTMRVAVFAEGDKAREAEEAGADVVGSADLAAKIEGGFVDFDVAIATPDQMGNVGKLGRVLGPRGLMPNPKTGTVTFDVGKAVTDAKAGKLEYRTDRGANVHVRSARRASTSAQLLENYARSIEEIVRAKPAGGEGPLHQADHADDDDGPRHPRRPGPRPRASSRSSTAPPGGSSGLAFPYRQPVAEDSRQPLSGRGPAEVALRSVHALRRSEPASVRARSFQEEVRDAEEREGTGRRRADRAAAHGGDADRRRLPRPDERRARRRCASKLLEHGARFSVVKNTLTRRAAEAAGADALLALLEGPTAIAFVESDGDPVAVAKALADAATETKILALRGGVLEGAVDVGARRSRAREAAAGRRAARAARRRDRRAADAARRARRGAAARPRRADRRPDRAARRSRATRPRPRLLRPPKPPRRGGCRGRRGRAGRGGSGRGAGRRSGAEAEAAAEEPSAEAEADAEPETHEETADTETQEEEE